MCGVIIIGGELLAWWSWVQTEGHNITNGLFVVVVVVVVFTKYHFKKILKYYRIPGMTQLL